MCGSHPSFDLASPISGLRRAGSSGGRGFRTILLRDPVMAITFSALIVIGALLSLVIAQFGFYQGLGPALAIGIALMLLAGPGLLVFAAQRRLRKA